jgi:PAS domain S-box-containing protein
VAAVATLSALAAAARARLETYADRMQLLAGVGDVVDGSMSLQETIERVLETLVPTLADICILDTVGPEGAIARKAVRAHGASRRLEPDLAALAPTGPRAPGATRAVLTGKPVLVENLDERILAAAAADESELALMRRAGIASGMFLPLRARGRTLGALTLLGCGRRHFRQRDLAFAVVLSGRVALGLDNAGLSMELVGVERRLTAIMGSLAEAVTVQNDAGDLVYANPAAAELLGFDSADELLAADPAQVIERFEMCHEDGSAVALEELPGRRVLAGETPQPLLVRVRQKRTGEQSWRTVKASAVRDVEGRPLLAVNVIEDVTEAKQAEFRQRFLAGASERLTSSLDVETTLSQLARLAVGELSDWCSIHMAREDESPEVVAIAHRDPKRIAFAEELHRRYPVRSDDPIGIAAVLRDGRAELLQLPDDELIDQNARDAEHARMLRELEIRSLMTVPMRVAERTIGAIVFVNSGTSRLFDQADLDLAEELGRRAATAVENARLYGERTEVARTLQQGLLPPALPEMDGWVASSLYRAAGEQTQVGGDFYDVFAVPEGWMIVVGDVAGRGAPAASLTALVRYTLRTAGQLGLEPDDAFTLVNTTLRERGDLSLCAVVAAKLRDDDGKARATFVCAGSPPPLLVRSRQAEIVDCEFGPFLGGFEDGRWTPSSLALGEGEQLVVYTDGVLDARRHDERFGEQRLRDAIRGARRPSEVIAQVEAALDGFERGSRRDDTAILAVMRTATAVSTVDRPADRLAAGAR